MVRWLVVLVLLVVIVIGVGFYRGWFHFSSIQKDGQPAYTVTVDKEKLKQDQTQANQKLQDMEQKVREKLAPATQP